MQVTTFFSIRNINYDITPSLEHYLIVNGNIVDTASYWFTKDVDKPEDKQRWIYVTIGAKPFKEQK